jgi:hypothetical protein
MQLTIVAVCVDYSDMLAITYEKNKSALKGHNYWIITSEADTKTQTFCQDNKINYFVTNLFYKKRFGKPDPFNKGAAINDFFFSDNINLDQTEWILFTDADIILKDALTVAIAYPKDEMCLYGCARKIYNTKIDYNEGIFTSDNHPGVGYFQLFHKNAIINKINNRIGFLEERRDASRYDFRFLLGFKKQNKLFSLPTTVDHLGPIGENWRGRVSELW